MKQTLIILNNYIQDLRPELYTEYPRRFRVK